RQCVKREFSGVNKKDADQHDGNERYEFADSHHDRNRRGLLDTCKVYGRNERDDRDYRQNSDRFGCRKESTQVRDEEIRVRGDRRYTDDPVEPSDLKTCERAERLSRVKVWSAAFAESAPNLGVTKHEKPDHDRAGYECEKAVCSDLCKDGCRKAENASTDDRVYHDGGEIPPCESS